MSQSDAEQRYRKLTPAENLRVLAARLFGQTSPAEKREIEEAATALEQSESDKNWLRAQRQTAEERLQSASAPQSSSALAVAEKQIDLDACNRMYEGLLETVKQQADALVSATATHPDTERLDWLAHFMVEVRTRTPGGSTQLFAAFPGAIEGLGDDEPSNIRAQIDYQRNGGARPDRTSERKEP